MNAISKLSNNSFRYDVFISYAHEDSETAKWLCNFLESYWVPGHKKRSIFLDSGSLSAGGLSAGIIEALNNSRYLIVCCSGSSLLSLWVNKEICTFVALDRADAILTCQVGDTADSQVPKSIQLLEGELGEALYKPDLRGNPSEWEGQFLQDKKSFALALLAPVVGLQSKDSLMDHRRRWQLRLTTFSLITVFIFVLSFGARQWWLSTAEGMFHTTLENLAEAAKTETIDDLALVDTLINLGRIDMEPAIRNINKLLPSAGGMANLGLAAGLASLPQPQCGTTKELLSAIDMDTHRTWPQAALIHSHRCNENWIKTLEPNLNEADQIINWAIKLAHSGNTEKSLELLNHRTLTGKDRFELQLQVIPFTPKLKSSPKDFESWSREDLYENKEQRKDDISNTGLNFLDSHSILYQVTTHLSNMDIYSHLSRPEAEWLTSLGVIAANTLDPHLVNNWSLKQKLAATLAAMGKTEEAIKQLITTDELLQAFKLDAGCQPEGWAWRSLAQYRIGNKTAADNDMLNAESCGRAEQPQSRTWQEWNTLVLSYVLANKWQSAFKAASVPRNQRARLLTQAYLVNLWVIRAKNR